MFVYLIILISTLWAGNESLNVLDRQIHEYVEQASCRLLRHRELERQKVLRELNHLKNEDFSDVFLHFAMLNYFSTNQIFFDRSIWQDESIKVQLTLDLSKAFRGQVEAQGLENIFISIRGQGVQWVGRVKNFPASFKFEIDDLGKLVVSYRIYRAQLCFEEPVDPDILWISDPDFDFHEL